HPLLGLQPYQARNIAYKLGLETELHKQAIRIFMGIEKLFRDKDLSLVEINPLVITKEGLLMALDAKINAEDNGLIRQPEIAKLHDPSQENPLDVLAAKNNLNYINLDGNIGCMVNGAGLAMATMDIIMLYGGMPANFLDVGGSASTEMVKAGFEIILQDPKVKGILINIFGGIMKCDVIANGIVKANKAIHLRLPLVVRLEGTNVELGKKILSASGLAITTAESMADAAYKICDLVNPKNQDTNIKK
ncbi:MAG: succinate--CoA ligase subunit beta, partial [Chlamydiota bacterium]|nr:succinate--CoA ligase subunit beta [Chlamydiota bacterium]